jgi:hypothetical protein
MDKGLSMMKTQGDKSFSARRVGAVAAVAFAIVATMLPSAFAAGEVLGKACKLEGVSTGTSSTSLTCKADSKGKLTWQKVRLGQSFGAPIAEITHQREALNSGTIAQKIRLTLQRSFQITKQSILEPKLSR